MTAHGSAHPPATAWFGIFAAILIVAMVGVGLALSIPLLSIEMERMGVSGRAIGLNTAMAGLASLIFVPFVPKIAARIGIGRLIALAILTASLSFLAFRAVLDFYAWFAIRFVFSAALGALFVLSEYWIASAAPPARRGLVMGIYGTVLSIGFAIGPSLLALSGTQGWTPYLAGARALWAGWSAALHRPPAPATARCRAEPVHIPLHDGLARWRPPVDSRLAPPRPVPSACCRSMACASAFPRKVQRCWSAPWPQAA